MHCIYLGVTAWLYQRILFAAHLFPGAGGDDSPKQQFLNAMSSIQWPGYVTQFPKGVHPSNHLPADIWDLADASFVCAYAVW
jgi:hypothetical protein